MILSSTLSTMMLLRRVGMPELFKEDNNSRGEEVEWPPHPWSSVAEETGGADAYPKLGGREGGACVRVRVLI
ncbi:hypothetical protein NL676_013806 [Syzygium grande]|nr:hypothetical protein NL676_013806 [Syzygium grande]